MPLKLVLGALSVVGAQGTLSWIRAGNTETCVGIQEPCDSLETCTRVGVGPCTNATAGPSFYITSEFIGLGYVGNASAYLTDNAQVKVIDPYQNANNGYRDFSESMTSPDNASEYAYVMTGAYFGADPNLAGGYVGVASFVMKRGTVSTKTNGFYYAGTPGAARVNRSSSGGSSYGAPDGPQEVCIAAKKNNACGDNIQYSAGDYKFSIYGYTTGSNYATATQAGSNGFPSPTNYIGVRTKLTAHGLTSLTASFNAQNISLTDLGSTDVTSMHLGSNQGTVTYAFPTSYNVGTDTSVPAATKTVKIKVSAVTGDAKSVYVDYLFDSTEFTAKDVYFVYDPTTTASSQATSAPSSGSGSNTNAATTTAAVSSANAFANYAFAPLLLVGSYLAL